MEGSGTWKSDTTGTPPAKWVVFVREAPRSGPLFDDLTRAKSAKELKEHLATRVLGALLLTQVLRKGVQIWGLR